MYFEGKKTVFLGLIALQSAMVVGAEADPTLAVKSGSSLLYS